MLIFHICHPCANTIAPIARNKLNYNNSFYLYVYWRRVKYKFGTVTPMFIGGWLFLTNVVGLTEITVLRLLTVIGICD